MTYALGNPVLSDQLCKYVLKLLFFFLKLLTRFCNSVNKEFWINTVCVSINYI